MDFLYMAGIHRNVGESFLEPLNLNLLELICSNFGVMGKFMAQQTFQNEKFEMF